MLEVDNGKSCLNQGNGPALITPDAVGAAMRQRLGEDVEDSRLGLPSLAIHDSRNAAHQLKTFSNNDKYCATARASV